MCKSAGFQYLPGKRWISKQTKILNKKSKDKPPTAIAVYKTAFSQLSGPPMPQKLVMRNLTGTNLLRGVLRLVILI